MVLEQPSHSLASCLHFTPQATAAVLPGVKVATLVFGTASFVRAMRITSSPFPVPRRRFLPRFLQLSFFPEPNRSSSERARDVRMQIEKAVRSKKG